MKRFIGKDEDDILHQFEYYIWGDNFGYIPITKVMSSSINHCFLNQFAKIVKPLEMGYRSNMSELADLLSERKTFAFVRNPWSRFVSAFRFQIQNNNYNENYYKFYGIRSATSFSACLEILLRLSNEDLDKHFRPQYSQLFHNGKQIPEFIGQLENSEEDWITVCDRYIGEYRELPRVNEQEFLRYQDYFDDKGLLSKFNEKYEMDIEIFGYTF